MKAKFVERRQAPKSRFEQSTLAAFIFAFIAAGLWFVPYRHADRALADGLGPVIAIVFVAMAALMLATIILGRVNRRFDRRRG